MSFLLKVIETFETSPLIKMYVDRRMRLFVEPTDTSRTFIILSNVASNQLATPVSDTYLSKSQYIQIDVQSKSYTEVTKVADEVRKIMWKEFNMNADVDGLDTYFEETKRYIVSRRFSGIPKNINYKEVQI